MKKPETMNPPKKQEPPKPVSKPMSGPNPGQKPGTTPPPTTKR